MSAVYFSFWVTAFSSLDVSSYCPHIRSYTYARAWPSDGLVLSHIYLFFHQLNWFFLVSCYFLPWVESVISLLSLILVINWIGSYLYLANFGYQLSQFILVSGYFGGICWISSFLIWLILVVIWFGYFSCLLRYLPSLNYGFLNLEYLLMPNPTFMSRQYLYSLSRMTKKQKKVCAWHLIVFWERDCCIS